MNSERIIKTESEKQKVTEVKSRREIEKAIDGENQKRNWSRNWIEEKADERNWKKINSCRNGENWTRKESYYSIDQNMYELGKLASLQNSKDMVNK